MSSVSYFFPVFLVIRVVLADNVVCKAIKHPKDVYAAPCSLKLLKNQQFFKSTFAFVRHSAGPVWRSASLEAAF